MNSDDGKDACSLAWAGPHGPHGDCPGVTKPWWWSARFYWREFKVMREFRQTHDRPGHITRWRWRVIEYRFAWAITKRVLRRAAA